MIKTVALSLTLLFVTSLAFSIDNVHEDDSGVYVDGVYYNKAYNKADCVIDQGSKCKIYRSSEDRYVFKQKSISDDSGTYRFVSDGVWHFSIAPNSKYPNGFDLPFREIARTPYFIEIELVAPVGSIEIKHKLYGNRAEVTVNGQTMVIRGSWVK